MCSVTNHRQTIFWSSFFGRVKARLFAAAESLARTQLTYMRNNLPKELYACRGTSAPQIVGTSELFAHRSAFACRVCAFRATDNLLIIIRRQNHLCAYTVVCKRVSEDTLHYIHANWGTPPPLHFRTALGTHAPTRSDLGVLGGARG